MEESPSSTSSQDPLPTWTSTTSERFPSTTGSSDHLSTGTGLHPSTSPWPNPSSPPNYQNQFPTFPSLIGSSLSASPSSSSEPSIAPFAKKPAKSLNVTAIAIGVTGAALLLTVCAVILFYLRRRKQKKKVPPSAEFMDFAATRQPPTYHEMDSPASSTFTPRDGMSFVSLAKGQ
ncbi:hypothetical protein BDM02DRAFT_3108583 [Thelephora ganbajun]|uniref:Uncharacterized protein n=1 Tax=Thelephora ganbajun TaxID=370292 RepID=A0ACB6ZU07_THEGA|nr:hypothetical protein BDM02DRAFT_3108583 [Thelephora ganbajun]